MDEIIWRERCMSQSITMTFPRNSIKRIRMISEDGCRLRFCIWEILGRLGARVSGLGALLNTRGGRGAYTETPSDSYLIFTSLHGNIRKIYCIQKIYVYMCLCYILILYKNAILLDIEATATHHNKISGKRRHHAVVLLPVCLSVNVICVLWFPSMSVIIYPMQCYKCYFYK